MTIFITGTDTGIGKTIAAAWVVLHTYAKYWKPVQSGLEDGTDAQVIRELTGCAETDIIPSRYELKQPLSPHEAAKRDGVTINLDQIALPVSDRPVVVEGAGGLLVPLNEREFMIDLIVKLDIPSILVCRSGLGTINHTLLSIDAMRARELELRGVIMVGPRTPENRQAIEAFGKVPVIAEIPVLEPPGREALLAIDPEVELRL